MAHCIMWDYIRQETEVLTKLFRDGQMDTYISQDLRNIEVIYFVAHGSSYNAAVSMTGFFTQKAQVQAYAYTPLNFRTEVNLAFIEKKESSLVVVISQTGTSSGVIEALEYAKSTGMKTLSVTAVSDSPIAKKADHMLSLCCGNENSNAKTKGYSATLTVLMLFALQLGWDKGVLGEGERQNCLDEIEAMIERIPMVFELSLEFCKKHNLGVSMQDLFVLGSGINSGTAQEGQLKVMETMCIPTMFNDIGEFSHGMHRAINENSSILLIKGTDSAEDQMERAYLYLKNITEHVWMIDVGERNHGDVNCIGIPEFYETQSILLTTLVIQVMAVYAPERINKDPNRDAHDDFTIWAGTRQQMTG